MKPHNIFFMPNFENREFTSVLHDVQNFITSEHSTLIAKDDDDSKAQIKRFILKHLQDKHITVEDMTSEELVEALYSEMKEFGFLTKYIYGKNVEEIDINSWRDIEIQYSNGLT
ncbi:MAG: type II secretion system protein E, partial [Christensenellaceae bacterium]